MAASKGRSGKTVPARYFRDLYRAADDPWGFATSPYERERFGATLAALGKTRYRSALELGCSTGVFTRMLAERCDALLAVDVSEDALVQAASRCAGVPWVRFDRVDLTATFPDGRFDLVTFCEIGYYFSPHDLTGIRDAIANALEPQGECVLGHWLPLVEGHAQTADDVHDAFAGDARFVHRAGTRPGTYRLDVFTRAR